MSVSLLLNRKARRYEAERADKMYSIEEEAADQAQAIMDQFKKDNPNAKK